MIKLDESGHRVTVAVDKNGNGIQDPGDTGDFKTCQQYLRYARAFVENLGKGTVSYAEVKDIPVDLRTPSELFVTLGDGPEFEKFRRGKESATDCAPNEILQQGDLNVAKMDTTETGGPGLLVQLGLKGITARHFSEDRRVEYRVVGTSQEGVRVLAVSVDKGCDGMLDELPSFQNGYEGFLEGLREFIKHPDRYTASQCVLSTTKMPKR